MAREAYIQMGNGTNRVDLGVITGISDTVSTSANVPTIPMLKAEQQFGIDTGATSALTVTSYHINDTNDTGKNWMTKMINLINRWQASTNGNRFKYTPADESANLIPSYDENVFLSKVSFSWSAGEPDVVKATTTMNIGSICGIVEGESESISNAKVQMTNADRNASVTLMDYSIGYSIINECTIKGGINQPFESITLRIQRRALLENSGFSDTNAIQPGKNIIRVQINGLEERMFIATSLDSKDNYYTVTGYAISELFRGMVLDSPIDCNGSTPEPSEEDEEPEPSQGLSPMDVIRRICSQGIYLQGYGTVTFDVSDEVYGNHDWLEAPSYPVFPKGTNVWYILQVCGYAMGANVYFTGNTCVVTNHLGSIGSYHSLILGGDIDGFYDVTHYEYGVSKKLVGVPEIGSAETNNICNNINAYYGLAKPNGTIDYSNIQVDVDDVLPNSGSKEEYGTRTSTKYLPGISSTIHVGQICKGMMLYSIDSCQSITFDRMSVSDSTWELLDDEYNAIEDKINEYLSSSPSYLYALLLAEYTLKLPECITEYRYGAISPVNLSNTVSQIEQALSKKRTDRYNIHILIKSILDWLNRIIWNL